MNPLPLLLVPVCALLNHLGGQSTAIPDPRIVCRVFGVPMALACTSLLCGLPIESCALLLVIAIAGMALWAIPTWGNQFMAVDGGDRRDYTKLPWLCWITDLMTGDDKSRQLTIPQVRLWGMAYGTARAAFLYPMYAAFGVQITLWAYLIGLSCLLNGAVYRFSGSVRNAEWIIGGIMGASFAAILILS